MRRSFARVRPLLGGSVVLGAIVLDAMGALSCTTVDPGPNYIVPVVQFNADYFYCHVEPTVIFGNGCGDKTMGACHYTPSAVTGLTLQMHQPIQCSDGTHPDDPTQVQSGTPAQNNYSQASFEMNRDYTTAPFYLRPTQALAHPVQLFPGQANDPNVMVIATWATK